MYVNDLDVPVGKISEAAQRVIDRAIEASRRYPHVLVTSEHLLLAFAQVEWSLFTDVMRDVELNPHAIVQAVESEVRLTPHGEVP